MKLYRLLNLGTMLYYNGSIYGRLRRLTRHGRLYRRRCDLTNSVKLVQEFDKSQWELQTFHLTAPQKVERYDGQEYEVVISP